MKSLSLIGLFVSFCLCNVFSAEPENMVKNPGFEQSGQKEWQFATSRGTIGKSLLVSDGRSGGKCAQLTMSSYKGKTGSVKCVSGFISIPTGTSEVQVSAWVKGKDIVKGAAYDWEKFRFVLQSFDSKKKRIKQWGTFNRDGSFDWTKAELKILLPPKAVYLKIDFQLLRCKGTAWIDDVKLVSVGKKAGSLADNLQKLISSKTTGFAISPTPWKAKFSKEYASLLNPVLVNNSGVNVKRAISELNIIWKNKLKSGNPDKNTPTIYLQKPDDKALSQNKLFKSQGYVLEVKNNPDRVYIKAFSPAGFFWGVQTLKQVIEEDGRIKCCTIKDRPAYAIRGTILQGRERGFAPAIIKKKLDEMKSFKLNTLLTTGSLLNYKFCQKWREPFSSREQKLLKNYISECNKNFITPLMLIAPRRFRKRNKRYGTGSAAIVFSSESDIELLFKKVDVLYDAGARFIGIPFDDLPQFGLEDLVNAQDKKKFKSVGDAHVYLTNRLYQYLAKKPEPCRVVFLPAPYHDSAFNTPRGERYLKSVRKLHASIEMIICATNRQNILKVKKITGCKNIIIWSNWLAHWGKHKPMPPILPPYPGKNFSDIIDGYIYLASNPREASRNSDYTVCDYLWNPADYNPERSQLGSLVKIFPKKSLKLLTRFDKLAKKIRDNEFAGNDSAAKAKTIDTYIKKLNSFKNEFKNTLKGEMKKQYLNTIDGYLKKCNSIKQLFLSKTFPVSVNKNSHKIKLDGKLDDDAWKTAESCTGFIKVKTFNRAKLQTSFKLLHDEKFLYIAISCLENPGYKLESKIKKHDGKVYLDDCVDIFIRPEAGYAYFHIIANSAGVIWDAIVNLKDGWVSDNKWSSQAKVFVSKTQNAWTVEMAIPFSNLGAKPSVGTKWGFNIGREKQGKNKEFSSFSGVFHDPSRFWEIVFK